MQTGRSTSMRSAWFAVRRRGATSATRGIGRGVAGVGALILSVVLGGCGSDGGTTGPPQNQIPPELVPLVGSWRAVEVIHVLQADTTVSVEIVSSGGRFDLSITGDGRYSAELVFRGAVARESGTIRVAGSALFLTPQSPNPRPEGRVTWSLQAGRMIWDGESQLDFNGDGMPSPSLLHVEFVGA